MKVTLEFDDKEAADNFIAWWKDEGQQKLDYYTESFDLEKKYLRVEGTGKGG